MYENNTHTVSDRIVSISQLCIRLIVCEKVAAPMESGTKLDLSIDENDIVRLEKLSFDAYNEADVLIRVIEIYYERTGHYPERVLAVKIYRNWDNMVYCKLHGIRLSVPRLGRPKKDALADKRTEYIDNAEHMEVERSFSLDERCYGFSRIMTKLDVYKRSSICIVHSGDECSPHSGSFIEPIIDITIFKMQSAGFHAVIYTKIPWQNVNGLLDAH